MFPNYNWFEIRINCNCNPLTFKLHKEHFAKFSLCSTGVKYCHHFDLLQLFRDDDADDVDWELPALLQDDDLELVGDLSEV